MLTGHDAVINYYEGDQERDQWKLYKGDALMFEGVADSPQANRDRLGFALGLLAPGRYKIVMAKDFLPAHAKTQTRAEFEVLPGAGMQANPWATVSPVGGIEGVIEARVASAVQAATAMMKKDQEIADLKRQLEEGVGDTSPTFFQNWLMKTVDGFAPHLPAIIAAISGARQPQPPPLEPQPQHRPQQPRPQPQPQPAAGDTARLEAVLRRMAGASPNWLDSLDKLSQAYERKPGQLEQMLPMLETL